MDSYIWIPDSLVKVIHDDQIKEHGGSFGIRDKGLLNSALARPKNLSAYEKATLTRLGAAYAYGIVRNHSFIDGNKRTAFQVMFTFLKVNGKLLDAPEPEVVIVMTSLAEGSMNEDDLVDWLTKYLYSDVD